MRIQTLDELEALYGSPLETSLVKEVDHVTPHYSAMIAASPVCQVQAMRRPRKGSALPW